MTSKARIDVKRKMCFMCTEGSAHESHQKKRGKVSRRQKTFQCEICSKILKHKNSLMIHKEIHLNKVQCHICSKEFSQRQLLKSHLRTHFGLEESKCHLCSEEFCNMSYLTLHLKHNAGIKELKCHLCSKEFFSEMCLKNHLKTHDDLKKFWCQLCSKEFVQKHSLLNHLKTHYAMEKFKCEVCWREFKHMESLKSHISVHSKVIEVKIQLHTNKTDLNKLPVAHSQLKDFRCHICGDEFSAELYLEQHILKHNDKIIVIQNSSSGKEDVDGIALESDPDVDPLLIEDEIPPVVKEEVPDFTLSEEIPSMLNRKDFIGNESLVRNERNIDNKVYQKYIYDTEDIDANFVKEEEFFDYDHENLV